MDLSIYLSIALVFFFIEHRFSYRPTSLKNRLYYLVRDLPFALVNLLLPPFLIKKVIFFYSDFLNKTIPNFDFLFPREEMNGIGILFLGFVISDFIGFLLHRYLYHGVLFKYFHSVHHNGDVVRWHSAYRFNPFELVLTTSIIYMLFYPIGIPPELFYKLSLYNLLINYLNHSELPLGHPLIEKFFVTPNYHVIHHSVEPSDQRSNFGGVFTIWDTIWKTRNEKKFLLDKKLGTSL